MTPTIRIVGLSSSPMIGRIATSRSFSARWTVSHSSSARASSAALVAAARALGVAAVDRPAKPDVPPRGPVQALKRHEAGVAPGLASRKSGLR
jgi:hypothetical protein